MYVGRNSRFLTLEDVALAGNRKGPRVTYPPLLIHIRETVIARVSHIIIHVIQLMEREAIEAQAYLPRHVSRPVQISSG
jgi:hypothetical protein